MVKMIINKKIHFLTAILFTVSIFPKLSNAEENIWREIKIIERTIEDDDEALSLQLNRRLGQLYRDVAEDDEAAFAAFAAAVRLAPGDDELRAELEVIATRAELFVF